MAPLSNAILGETADGTATALPLLQAGAMKYMLTKYCEQPRRFVHSLEAYWTGG